MEENNLNEKKTREVIDVDKAIFELKEIAKEFDKIEDISVFAKNNQQELRNLFLGIISWVNYIKREDNYGPKFGEAVDIIVGIAEKHPKIDHILQDFLFSDEKSKEKTNDGFDKSGLKNKIYGFVDELNSRKVMDSDLVFDDKFLLETYKEEVVNNRASFSNEEYNDLISLIDGQLNKIDKFVEFHKSGQASFKSL